MKKQKVKIGINYGPDELNKLKQTITTLSHDKGFRGRGGHKVDDHFGHGRHWQVSIGVDDTTFNLRFILGS